MGISIKFKADKTGFKDSVRTLRKQLNRDIRNGLRTSGKVIAKNVRGRLSSSYPSLSGNKSKSVLENIYSSQVIPVGDDLFVGIGNIVELDKATEVMAKSTGKVYHLWRLMELGYGMRGGFRDDLYDIYPLYPTSAQGQFYYRSYGGTRRKGVHHSNPERKTRPALVFYANGRLIFAAHVRHPGAAGRHFFLTMSRDWYAEDMSAVRFHVLQGIQPLLDKVNYKG